MSITELIPSFTTTPNRNQPATFSADTDAYHQELAPFTSAMNTWASQANTLQAEINAKATAVLNTDPVGGYSQAYINRALFTVYDEYLATGGESSVLTSDNTNLQVYKNGTELFETTDYTLNVDGVTIDLVVSLSASDVLGWFDLNRLENFVDSKISEIPETSYSNVLIDKTSLAPSSTIPNVEAMITHLYSGTGASNPINLGVGLKDMNWVTTKTYALDEIVIVRSGTDFTVYKSLQAGNLNNLTSDGAWWVVSTQGSGAFTVNEFVGQVHIKGRNIAYSNYVHDGLRGATSWITSNGSSAESSLAETVTDFTSTGLTLGTRVEWNDATGAFVLHATVYTHYYYDTTGSSKIFYVYNALTGKYLCLRTGSNSVENVYRHGKVAYQVTKRLDSAVAGVVYYGDEDYGLFLYATGSGSDARFASANWNNTTPTENTFTLDGNRSGTNQSGGIYSDEGFIEGSDYITLTDDGSKIVIEEKDINGLTSVLTEKNHSTTGNWKYIDYARTNVKQILLDTSAIETTITADTRVDGTTDTQIDLPTDNATLQLDKGVFTYSEKDTNNNIVNSKEEVLLANYDLTSIPNGVWYLAKEKNASVLTHHLFPVSNGHYTKTTADDNRYINLGGKQYAPDTVNGEVFPGGNFDTDVAGWTTYSNATLSWDASGRAKSTAVSTSLGMTSPVATGFEIGTEYSLNFILQQNADSVEGFSFQIDGVTQEVLITPINSPTAINISFTASATSHTFGFLWASGVISAGEVAYFSTISVFKKASTLGTALTTPISMLKKPWRIDDGTPMFEDTSKPSVPSNVMGRTDFTGVVKLNKNQYIVDFGTVSNNNRYVDDFPLKGTKGTDWLVRAEVFYEGVWSEVNQGTGNGSSTSVYGVKGYSNEEGIVVQTGLTYILLGLSEREGTSGHGSSINANVTSAPCRMICTYIGDTNE